jgi:NAD(P)-dependent dehydrogenase (short-subunit alcohol dehydrogenase family)
MSGMSSLKNKIAIVTGGGLGIGWGNSCLFAAGANTVVLQPLEGDPDCLDEYTSYLLPLIKEQYKSSRLD